MRGPHPRPKRAARRSSRGLAGIAIRTAGRAAEQDSSAHSTSFERRRVFVLFGQPLNALPNRGGDLIWIDLNVEQSRCCAPECLLQLGFEVRAVRDDFTMCAEAARKRGEVDSCSGSPGSAPDPDRTTRDSPHAPCLRPRRSGTITMTGNSSSTAGVQVASGHGHRPITGHSDDGFSCAVPARSRSRRGARSPSSPQSRLT